MCAHRNECGDFNPHRDTPSEAARQRMALKIAEIKEAERKHRDQGWQDCELHSVTLPSGRKQLVFAFSNQGAPEYGVTDGSRKSGIRQEGAATAYAEEKGHREEARRQTEAVTGAMGTGNIRERAWELSSPNLMCREAVLAGQMARRGGEKVEP